MAIDDVILPKGTRWNSTFKVKAMKPMKRTGFKASVASKTALRRTKLRKTSITPISKLKKQLWALCREITFKRHGSDCYTCSRIQLVGSNRHLGHFISSSVCSTELRYSLDNLRAQCYACNIFRSGNWPAYEEHLKRDGFDTEILKQRNRDTQGLKYDSIWYNNKIAEYTDLLARLS